MTATPIKLEEELRRIAREIDDVGSDPDPKRQFACSKYDSDLLRDAANEIERLQKGDRFPTKIVTRFTSPVTIDGRPMLATRVEITGD